LYLYSIKIQTNIDQNTVKRLGKSQIFEINFFEEFLFLGGVGPSQPAWLG
jgi:hypothetical protein